MSRSHQFHPSLILALACLTLRLQAAGAEQLAHEHKSLPNLDKRVRLEPEPSRVNDRQRGLAHLQELDPDVRVDFEPLLGTPKWIGSPQSFLSGPNGLGLTIPPESHRGLVPADEHPAIKAFLNE